MSDVKTIILLHGWGKSALALKQLADALGERGYDAIAVDLPGFGEAPPPPTGWVVDNYVQWLKEWLAREGIKEFVLFGHSFGGRIAIKYAAGRFDNISHLILCGAAGVPPRWTLWRAAFKAFSPLAKKIPGARMVARPVLKRLEYSALSGAMRDTFRFVVEEDLRPVMHAITVPTLLIWGMYDPFTPLRDARIMQKRMPYSKLQVFPDGDHALYRKQPQAVADAMDAFLRGDS